MSTYGHYCAMPDTAQALQSIEVQASHLARQGVNVVRVIIPFASWKWFTLQDPTNGAANWQAFVRGVFSRLKRNNIHVIVAMGNTFGEDPVAPIPSSNTVVIPRRYWLDSTLPSGKAYLVYDEIPWFLEAGVLQEPGNPLATNTSFLSNHWYPYIDTLITACKSETNLLAWELFNEPDNNIDYTAVAAMITTLKGKVASQDAGRPVMLGANSTVKMESLNGYLDPDPAVDWIADNVDAIGFHIMSAVMYRGGEYAGATATQVGYPGFPPDRVRDDRGLLNSSGTPTVFGVLPEIRTFLSTHNNREGFIEECCTRSVWPQLLHDLDLAIRDSHPTTPGSRDLGILYLTPAYSTLAPWPMDTNGGGPLIVRERLVMQDRYRLPVSTETTAESNLDAGVFNAIHDSTLWTAGKIYAPSTGTGSLAMRPLILRSATTTLVVASEPFEAYPTNTFFNATPSSSYSGRNKVWVLAFRDGSPGLQSGLLDLAQGTATAQHDLLALSADRRFKEVEDIISPSTHGSALRYRGSFMGVFNAANWISVYPLGEIGIDPTWGGLGAAGGAIPTLRNDLCTWSDYTARIASVELELGLRSFILGRQKVAYVGVSGKVAGVDLPLPSGQSDVKGRYLLAYHRAVPRKIGTASTNHTFSEHYGPGQDGGSTGLSATRQWSARYGDIYRRAAFNSTQYNQYDEPEKYEIVLVDLYVKETGTPGQLSFVPNRIDVLDTAGDDTSVHSTPGASAMDPLLARNSSGDVVILYRKIQDPYYEFNVVDDDSGLMVSAVVGGSGSGRCTSSQQNATTMLPIQNAPDEMPIMWQATANDSHWRQYPAVVAARMWRADATWFGSEQVASEPYATPTGGQAFYQETWSTWHADTKNVQQSGGPPVQLLDPGSSGYGQWISDRSPGLATLKAGQTVHAFHPVHPAAVQVGERISGDPVKTPVLVAWRQIPRERRSDWVRGKARLARDPAPYAVYALRLDGSTSNTLSVPSATTAYTTFGSTDGLVGLSPGGSSKGYDPLLTTWDDPAVHFAFSSTGSSDAERDTNNMLATWQQGVMLPQGTSSTTARTEHDALGSGVQAAMRSPVSGYEPRRGLLSPDLSLRLTAWCRPVVSSTQKIRVVCEWTTVSGTTVTPGNAFELNNEQGSGFETIDPNCRVVAVVPLARTVSGSPRGRVVWQADDDIWVADVEYALSGGNPVAPVVKRVTAQGSISPSGKGKFPTLLTEVSATGDVIAWTYAGKVHAVRKP